MKQVPFYAGCHHEKLNGGGYPNGYSGDQLPLQARIIAIADVFEGLTAPDRPYKEPYKLSKALNILKFMVNDGEIDRDLFNLLITKKLYLKYANEHLNSNQIDSIDEEKLLFEKNRFLRADKIIAVIYSPVESVKIPNWEMMLSTGAVCQNITCHLYTSPSPRDS